MNRYCPNCGKLLEENSPLRCLNCNIDIPTYIRINLENLKKEKDYLAIYKEKIDAEVTKKIKSNISRYIGVLAFICIGGLFLIYVSNQNITSHIVTQQLTEELKDSGIRQVINNAAKTKTEQI
ncbi:MAG: hypothetical protein NC908_03550, partial [Candidatus Omnitrophica bacterium]|nr:hypothetical protein [Candidatus Omnitrophota bacterium]